MRSPPSKRMADGKGQGAASQFRLCWAYRVDRSSTVWNGRVNDPKTRSVDRHLYGVSSPPIICRNVIVMGSKVNDIPLAAEMPPGDVRGFDVRTGKQQWTFHSIPKEGEFGNET
jgi:glucose dehydrogenase